MVLQLCKSVHVPLLFITWMSHSEINEVTMYASYLPQEHRCKCTQSPSSRVQPVHVQYGFTTILPMLFISCWQNVWLPPTDYIYQVNEPHTEHSPLLSIHFHSLLHPSPPPTFLPLFIPYEHNFQFHLKWQLSHLRKILESFFSRNSMVIHHVNGRTVYQLSETTLPAQCFEYALPTVSDC